MPIDLTAFNQTAIPLLQELANAFPLAVDVTLTDDEENNVMDAVVSFLINEGIISQKTNSSLLTLTNTGTQLFSAIILQLGN